MLPQNWENFRLSDQGELCVEIVVRSPWQPPREIRELLVRFRELFGEDELWEELEIVWPASEDDDLVGAFLSFARDNSEFWMASRLLLKASEAVGGPICSYGYDRDNHFWDGINVENEPDGLLRTTLFLLEEDYGEPNEKERNAIAKAVACARGFDLDGAKNALASVKWREVRSEP